MNAATQVEDAKQKRMHFAIAFGSILLFIIFLFIVHGHINDQKSPLVGMYTSCYENSQGDSTSEPTNCNNYLETTGYYSEDSLDSKIGRWNTWGSIISLLGLVTVISSVYVYRLFKDNESIISNFERNKIEEIRFKEAKSFEKALDFDAAIKIYNRLGAKDEILRIRTSQAEKFEKAMDYNSAINIWKRLGEKDQIVRIKTSQAESFEKAKEYDSAIEIWNELENYGEIDRIRGVKHTLGTDKAREFEQAGNYDAAIQAWQELGNTEEINRIRKERLVTRAEKLEADLELNAAIRVWEEIGDDGQIRRVKTLKAEGFEKVRDYDSAIRMWRDLGNIEDADRVRIQQQVAKAKQREKALDYDAAIDQWEALGHIEDAARVRRLKADQSAVKIGNISHVHGDYIDDRDTITKTEIKDSVVSNSNLSSDKIDRISKLKELKEMFAEDLIDKDEFKQMKKDLLGK